ncbi:hypothetical protein [Caldifermentibacillus hisashii]|uniref:hypothetical protein n=1 Tax=Caldifermentibacillus hisashii TaxID=996558 RepID=UPI0022B9B060|nr:hypothetical protein [Caldifermentibacillus hisashii]
MAFLASKWRRDRVSSPKQSIFHFKTVTRSGLVVKKWCFSPQNGDEIGFRRQKIAVFTSKRRRDRVSSPKNGVSRLKMVTRTGLVAKKWCFSSQNGDENRARRQKALFSTPNWRRD